MRSTVGISVIVTAQAQGRLAHRSLRSVRRAVDAAAKAGTTCEVLVILDRADSATSGYFQQFGKDIACHEVDFADACKARNHGVTLARGRYVTFLAAEDIFGTSWLAAAHGTANQRPLPFVLHPSYSVVFGEQTAICPHHSCVASSSQVLDLLHMDLWTYCIFAEREWLLDRPFPVLSSDSGFGHAIRHWFCERFSEGVAVQTVEQTCLFRRASSSVAPAPWTLGLMPASRLFDSLAWSPSAPPGPAAGIGGPGWRHSLATRMREAVRPRFDSLAQHKPALAQAVQISLGAAHQLRSAFLPRPAPPPAWLLSQWEAAEAVEPQLFPDVKLLASACIEPPRQVSLASTYIELSERFGPRASHVFLVPWIKRGGADLEILNYVHALSSSGFAQRIVVIADRALDSPWADRLPAGVRFIEFGKLCAHLEANDRQDLLARLLVQKAPEVIHNVNSYDGYEIFIKFGRALSRQSRLFSLVFCDNVTAQGRTVGYVFTQLPLCFDHLTAVFSDNQRVLDELVDRLALDPSKLRVHYQPIPPMAAISPRRQTPDTGPNRLFHVLWAGRLDRQKRPDLLEATARSCQEYPFHFHVYGYSFMEPCTPKWRELPNVTYHGPYEGFTSLPLGDFDAFLYTAQWDGLPNVLLEAMAAGLPVVASDAGGVREAIRNAETGFLVSPLDDVNQYVQALLRLHQDPDAAERIARNARALVLSRHSLQAFVSQLREISAYCVQSRAGSFSDV